MMPSDKDIFNYSDRHIRTISGKRFYLGGGLQDTSGIALPDICHALSHMGRFTGHTKRFYSVAEHSLFVYDILRVMEADRETLVQGLLHDSTEAYLADISSPFKPMLGNYQLLEERTWIRIARALGVKQRIDPMVKHADWIALFAEAAVLQPGSDVHTWAHFDKYGEEAMKYTYLVPEMKMKKARKELYETILAEMREVVNERQEEN